MKSLKFVLCSCLCFIQFHCHSSVDPANNPVKNSPPTEFYITVQDTSYTSAMIVWTAATDPEGGEITYRVYLWDGLVGSNISDSSYSFFNLPPNVNYSGKVIASDPDGYSTIATFSFNTKAGKVINGNVLLQTQQEVDAFAQNGYNAIIGDLYLGRQPSIYGYTYSDISDLSGLTTITTVEGKITVLYNRVLTNLTGLDNIIDCNYLYFEELETLQNIEGLHTLARCRDITIQNVDALEDLNGFEKITHLTGGLLINMNDQLKDIDALNNLKYVNGNIRIRNNPYLEKIDFPNLITVDGNFEILPYHNINDLSDLHNLVSVGGLFHISVPNISGLNKLTTVGSLTLSPQSVTGLQNLSSVGDISVGNSGSCTQDINYLQNITSVSGNIKLIESNVVSLQGLHNIKSIGGNLEIIDNYELRNLDDLANLTSIGGTFNLNDGDLILNVDGLSNLVSVGGIDFSLNYNLSNINGFVNLTSVESINITDNYLLYDFCGLKPLLGKDTTIVYNVNGNPYNPTKDDILSVNCYKY